MGDFFLDDEIEKTTPQEEEHAEETPEEVLDYDPREWGETDPTEDPERE